MGLGAAAIAASLFGGGRAAAQENGGRVIRHAQTNARQVALTYDDLWSEYYTLKIAKEYSRRDVRLTFFPAGRAVLNNLERPHAGYENLYPRLRDMGHEFGCHLFTHREINDFSLQQLIDEEMAPSLHTMRRALGRDFMPVGIRPPYGKVTDAVKALSARYGLPLILWGLDSQDAICSSRNEAQQCDCASASFESYARVWGPRSTDVLCSDAQCDDLCVEAIVRNYASYLRPGTIILHHAIKTAYLAIAPTLDLLRDWNMEPVSLSHLLARSG